MHISSSYKLSFVPPVPSSIRTAQSVYSDYRPDNWGLNPSRGWEFFTLILCPVYPMGTRGSFPGGKVAGV
jgi:hypothetical protein